MDGMLFFKYMEVRKGKEKKLITIWISILFLIFIMFYSFCTNAVSMFPSFAPSLFALLTTILELCLALGDFIFYPKGTFQSGCPKDVTPIFDTMLHIGEWLWSFPPFAWEILLYKFPEISGDWNDWPSTSNIRSGTTTTTRFECGRWPISNAILKLIRNLHNIASGMEWNWMLNYSISTADEVLLVYSRIDSLYHPPSTDTNDKTSSRKGCGNAEESKVNCKEIVIYWCIRVSFGMASLLICDRVLDWE